jgi:hypothetical protein
VQLVFLQTNKSKIWFTFWLSQPEGQYRQVLAAKDERRHHGLIRGAKNQKDLPLSMGVWQGVVIDTLKYC